MDRLMLFRWMLVPFLIYLFGQYLDGPPYRVIVHSGLSVVCCFALSVFAAQFLRQQRNSPPLVIAIMAIGIPSGFIYALQHYYNGGTDLSYTTEVLVFSVFMGINAAIFLISLFPRKTKVLESSEILESSEMHYKIELWMEDAEGRVSWIKFRREERGKLPLWIDLSGYSEDQCISLGPYWDEMIATRQQSLTTHVTVRETIVKFGDTHQLVDHYLLSLSLKYA